MLKLFLFLSTIVLVTAQYSISVTITCMDNSSGYCTKWQQSGSLSYSTSCFPANSIVMREDGALVRMDGLAVGDRILAYNPNTGEQEYSEIVAWLHRDPSVDVAYTGMQTKSDILWASPQHNVAIQADGQIKYVHSSDVTLGNKLISKSDSTEVNSVYHEMLHGIYAPYTRLANFYVGTSNATYLVHSFAYLRNPTYYESLFAASMWLAEYINPSIHVVEDITAEYFHPVALTLQKIFPFVVDIPNTSSRKLQFSIKQEEEGGALESGSNDMITAPVKTKDEVLVLTLEQFVVAPTVIFSVQ